MRAAVFDRYGFSVDTVAFVLTVGFVRVPLRFLYALSARTDRAFMRENLVLDLLGNPAGHRPGYVVMADDDYDDTARQLYIARLTNAWRGPVADNAEGVSTSDPPDDIAALPMAQQLADS